MTNRFAELTQDIHDRIREIAYLMWESAGRQHGMAMQYWLSAEQEVLTTIQAAAGRMLPDFAKPDAAALAAAAADAPTAAEVALPAATPVPVAEPAAATIPPLAAQAPIAPAPVAAAPVAPATAGKAPARRTAARSKAKA